MELKAKTPAGGSLSGGQIVQRYGIVIALLLACLTLTLISDNFLTTRNVLNVLRQTSINGVLAIGMTFVILTRGIDLSVGSVVALSGVVAASFATTSSAGFIPGAPWPAGIAILIGLAVGMGCGAVSGVIVARYRVPAFVATLGMLSAARGLTLLYSGGRPIPALSETFRWIGTGSILGIPVPIFLLLGTFALAHFVLTQTRFGRHVYAVGGNPHAAKVSGLPVNRIRFLVYVISGALAGLAGASDVMGTSGQLQTPYSPNYGFVAIIVAFLGRLHPFGILCAGLLLALSYLGGENAQIMMKIPLDATRVIQGLLLFFVLACDLLVLHRPRLARRATA